MKDIRIIRAPVRCTTPIICGEMTNDSKAAKFHECGWIRRANQNGRVSRFREEEEKREEKKETPTTIKNKNIRKEELNVRRESGGPGQARADMTPPPPYSLLWLCGHQPMRQRGGICCCCCCIYMLCVWVCLSSFWLKQLRREGEDKRLTAQPPTGTLRSQP